jgi:hypothetical protein
MAPIRDWDRLRWPLARLIKGLSSLNSEDETKKVRQAITHAIVSGQTWDTVDPVPAPPEGPSDTSPRPIERRDGTVVTDDDLRLADTLRPADDSLVISQRVVLRPVGLHESSQLFIRYEHSQGLVPVSTFGPLLDALGRRLELTVYKQSAFTALRGGFFISTTTSPTQSPFIARFGECTLWVPANAFATTAPSNGYFGLRVKSGTATTPPVQWSNVVVELEQPAPWDGQLATRFSRTVPSSITITIATNPNPLRGTLSTTVGNTADVFGNSMTLRYAGATAEYDPITNRLSFPLSNTSASLSLSDVDSDFVHFSGTAQLTRTVWSFPVMLFSTTGQFSAVAGNGAISLTISPGLRSRYLDDQDIWTYGDVEVAIDDTAVSISGNSAWTNATRSLDVWLHGDPRIQHRSSKIRRSTITLKSKSTLKNLAKRGFTFKYLIQANGRESWSYATLLSASLGSPITVNGAKTSFNGIGVVLLARTKAGSLPQVAIESRRTGSPAAAKASYAMENMLLSASNVSHMFAYGEYSWQDRSLISGSITLPASLLDALPILPDPYATNTRKTIGEFIGDMLFRLRFDGIREVNATVQLPPNALGRITALTGSPFDPETRPEFRFKLPAVKLWEDISAGRIANSSRYTSLEPYLRNEPAFLDVSTNSSHLGISFSPQNSPLVVKDMTASTYADQVRVFSPPAVHWESLYMTEPTPGNKINYPSSGIGTKLTTESVTLVPIAPRHVLNEAISAYNPINRTVRPRIVAANVQLPFGAHAKVATDKETPAAPSKRLRLVQPVFQKEATPSPGTTNTNENNQVKLTGGPQVSFRCFPADEPRGFPGFAFLPYQEQSPLPNFITTQFNQDFSGLVPLTGLDISGYGASMFSTWQPTVPPPVGISKVTMDVVVGRTAREVVQMSSIMYPYGVRVIRTVTIVRLNNGRVEGRDSGWLAASDGYYDFGEPAAGQERLKIHLGLVRGVKQVTNIKPVDGSENVVKFDCYMDIEGSEDNKLIPAQNQTGYIVTRSSNPSEPPKSLAANDYAVILQTHELGGPVDAIVRLGNSQQRLRVSRVLAGRCQNTTQGRADEFPMELWGTPLVPGGGQWAFTNSVQKELGKGVQTAVDSWGVPVVRKGLDGATRAASAIRIASAWDALSESSAYNLIHSADTHRLMFPAPELLPAAAGNAIRGFTSKVPLLADGFALATSNGIFPEVETCIPLEGASQVLKFLDGGHYEYKPVEQGKLALKELERHLRQDGNFASVVSTAGKLLQDGQREKAYLDMVISTATGAKDLSLSNLSMITQGAGGKELNRVVGSVLSSATKLPIFQNAEHIFGELLGQVQKVVNFLNKLKVLPPLKVSMTNEWALEVSTSMGLDDFLQRLGVGEGAAAIKEIIQGLNFALKARTTPTSAVFTMAVDVTIKIPTGLGPAVLGVGGFKVRAGTEGNVVEMTLGAGIGLEIKVGPFGASAYYSQSQSIIISKDIYGVAATCVLKVHVNLVVATADLLLEARLGLIGGPCSQHDQHHEDTIYAYAQVRIALHVSIFLVINCSVDETAEWNNNMNNGPCHLPLMKPMP